MERMQHIDAIRKLGDVDDTVRLLAIGNAWLLDEGPRLYTTPIGALRAMIT
jgi:hypothetical protein